MHEFALLAQHTNTNMLSHISICVRVYSNCLPTRLYVYVRLFKHFHRYHSAGDSLHTCHLTAPVVSPPLCLSYS